MYVQRAFSVSEVSPRHLVYALQDTTAHEVCILQQLPTWPWLLWLL